MSCANRDGAAASEMPMEDQPKKENRSLTAALGYIKRNWAVFPILGKEPIYAGGFYTATLDPAQAFEWWGSNREWGVGLPTGFKNGILVLDIDVKNGARGMESLALLKEEHGDFTKDVPCVQTGTGGLHFYFQYPAHQQRTILGLLPGLDIKADGGFVVVPPSFHPETRQKYIWTTFLPPEHRFPEVPAWLLDMLRRHTPSQAPDDTGAPVLDNETGTIPTNHRNSTLFRIAAQARHYGGTYETILPYIEATNRLRCEQPLDQGELDTIVRSALRYAPTTPVVTVSPPEPIWKPLTLEEILDPNAGQVEELVKSVVVKGGVTLLVAGWKSGKTLITYRLTLDAVRGVPVWGFYPCLRPLKIAVFQLEMPRSEDFRRLRNLALGSGVDLHDIPKWAASGQLSVFNRPPMDLANKECIAEFHKIVLEGGYDLVIIDSVIAAFAGADINDNSRVRRLFNDAFNALTSKGVSILLMHHTRKAKEGEEERDTVLGAQTWGAASDRIFTLRKLKPEPGDPPRYFKTRVRALGGWAPTDIEFLELAVRDEGDETISTHIEPIDDHSENGIGAAERAASLIPDLLLLEGQLTQPELIDRLKKHPKKIGRNSALAGIHLAIARGEVRATGEGKRGDPVTFLPVLQDEEDELVQ